MNILVHNAVMGEELPAGGCSVFTIFHVAPRNRVCVCVCVWGGHNCPHMSICVFPTFKHIASYRVRVSIIEGRLN